jgi:hypothetical protein
MNVHELFKQRKIITNQLQKIDAEIERLLEQENTIREKTMVMKLNDCIGNCGRKTRSKEQLCKYCLRMIR